MCYDYNYEVLFVTLTYLQILLCLCQSHFVSDFLRPEAVKRKPRMKGKVTVFN
jgi:hypothetical protein